MMKYYKIYGDRCLEFGEKVVFRIWDKLGSKVVYVIARKVMGLRSSRSFSTWAEDGKNDRR